MEDEDETYAVVIGCNNCHATFKADVARRKRAGEWIKDNPECPTCRVGGNPQFGGTYTPLYVHGTTAMLPGRQA